MAKARGKRSVKGDLDELMAFTESAGEQEGEISGEARSPYERGGKARALAQSEEDDKKAAEPLPMVSIRAKGWVIGAMKIRKAATNQTFGKMLEEYVETCLPEEAEMAKKMLGDS